MEETTTMSTLLTSAGEIFAQAINWAGDTVTLVMSKPLFLLPAILGVAFLGVSLYRRLAG